MGLKIIALGAASLLFNEQSLDGLLGIKARALLLYTALQSQPVPRERLAAMFWKDFSQARASGNLRMTLMSLRHHLGADAHITRNDVEILSCSDVHIFQNTLNDLMPFIRGAQPWTDDQTQALESVLQLYKGPFLHNVSVPDAEQFESWSHATREILQRQFFKAADSLICHYEAMGRHSEELHWSSYLLKIDPLYEPAYRSLMRVYASRGDRILAIREFETCKRLLATELNVDPDQKTLQLYDMIAAGTFQEGRVLGHAAPVIMLPKRPIAHNLPSQLTPLIGRTTELREITQLFEEARLVTIVGTGGIGKTRLAVEFGFQRLAQTVDEDGAYFVDLSAIAVPAQVVEAVASVFNLNESTQHSLSAQIIRHLRNKRLLLILDNFEHVLDAADQLEDWLKAAPQLAILVTSREPLQLYAEYLYSVPSLPDADAWSLFARRVSAVKSGFVMNEDSATLIRAICARLEGLPLALELAASHAPSLSLAQILQGLDDSLTFLKSQRRGGPERQRTLYEAIEWSVRRLSPAEQALYSCLAVFAGGWSLAALADVAGDLAVHLPALVAKHLVQVVSDAPPRFRLLEPIREHARQMLAEQGEEQAIRELHLCYFATLAQQAERGLRSADERLWFDRLEPERENIRAAFTFASQHPDLAEWLCRLTAGMGYFFYLSGSTREGRVWVDKALVHLETLPVSLQADLLTSAGHIAHACADYDRANTYHEAALLRYQVLEDWVNTAFVMTILGMREAEQAQKLSAAEDAYQMSQRTQDDFVRLNAANSYAVALELEGQLEQAIAIYESIIASGAHLNYVTLRPFIIVNLAGLYRDIGLADQAAPLFEEAFSLVREGYVKFIFPGVAEEVGDFYYGLGDMSRAAAAYAEGLAAAQAISADGSVRRLHRGLAMIAWQQGQLANVKTLYHIAFDGSLENLSSEDWQSFTAGILHITVIVAAHQPITAARLLGSLAHHNTTRNIRLKAIHKLLQSQCLATLREQAAEMTIDEAMRQGAALNESEMFALALRALEALPE